MDSTSGTIRDLEEFRRRKAAQRKLVDAVTVTKPSSPIVTNPKMSQPLVLQPVEDREMRGSSQRDATSPVTHSTWDKFATWLYRIVMPERVINSQNTVVIDEDETASDVEDSDHITADGATVASDEVAPSGGFFAKLPFFLRSHYFFWSLTFLCGFTLSVRFGWGAVFFCVSVLILISKSLNDSRKKKRGTPSAYSVFNDNCERIEGTLDAEQLQRQMFLPF